MSLCINHHPIGLHLPGPRTFRLNLAINTGFSAPFALLSVKVLFFCANFSLAVRTGVAQIFNLLYRRIAFGGAPDVVKSFDPAAASGLQIRDTAEYNSALLRLRLRRSKLFCDE